MTRRVSPRFPRRCDVTTPEVPVSLPTPRLYADLGKLRKNTETISGWLGRTGLELFAVTKGVRGDRRIAQAFLDGGAVGFADSRLSNFRTLEPLRRARTRAGRPPLFLLLRSPAPAEVLEAAHLCDAVLCASADTAVLLAAKAPAGRPIAILLTVDFGDLREGLLPEDVVRAGRELEPLLAKAAGTKDPAGRAHVAGLATNMACFCGVIPKVSHLERLAALGRELGLTLGRPMRVSAGNTAVLPLVLQEKTLPAGLHDLRVGEGILLGRESLHRKPLPGCHLDVFSFWGTVIEVGAKPSRPTGECAQDAFGHQPSFADRGVRRRALVAAGRQDLVPEGLAPLAPGVEVLGATSDHLILDVEDYQGDLRVGTELGFSVNYACLLQAMTSPDVTTVYVGEA